MKTAVRDPNHFHLSLSSKKASKLGNHGNQGNENLAKLDCDKSLSFARVKREYTNVKQKKNDRAAKFEGAKRRKIKGLETIQSA